jgi:Glutaredoxin-like domain (DUF836)
MPLGTAACRFSPSRPPLFYAEAGRSDGLFRKGKMRLTLYQRDDCRLCDEAVALLAKVRAPDFESVWIEADAELEARYGARVPVIRDTDSGRELNWPFDPASLRRFLGRG